MRISVAVALAAKQEVIDLELPAAATVADAIAAARLDERFPGHDFSGMRAGIWSRAATAATVLREGDRVELYRPLVADPKAARRTRARVKPSSRSRSGP
jgi:putative ubiquitin-RnfH superfamily antitoxin RatB of RatAB toxin-antitoxin module